MYMSDKISPALDELNSMINPRLSREIKSALAIAPNPTDEQILLIGERAGFIAPEDLIREIDDLQLKYLAAYNAGMAHTPRAAGDAFRAYSESLSQEVISSESVSKCEGKTREGLEIEFRHKMKAAFQLAKTYGPKAREILQPHFARYVSACREYADMMAQSHQQLCEKLGLPWVPAHHIVMTYRAADLIEERAGRGHSPAECAAFLFKKPK